MTKLTCNGTHMNTEGEIPALGTRAPNFELVDINLEHRSLAADFAGKGVLINVYPSLDTNVCFESEEKFSQELKDKDLHELGVSIDTPFALKRISKALNFEKIILLSDVQKHEFGRRFGLNISDGPLQGFLARAVFLLDVEHTILHQELVSDIANPPNYQAIFDKLGKL